MLPQNTTKHKYFLPGGESMPKPMSFSYYTCEEVAAMLKITTQTVYDWIAAGKLPAIKIGKSYRIERGGVEALINRGRVSSKK